MTLMNTAQQEARSAWPQFQIEAAVFRDYLARRAGPEGGVASTEHIADLYLACACSRGDSTAIACFVERHGPDIRRLAARVQAPGHGAEDVAQILLDRLLVDAPERPAKIAGFRGVGSLRNWVRASAARLLIDLFRKSAYHREVSVEESVLCGLVVSQDPEVVYLRSHYSEELRAAFREAVASLSPQTRNYLRHVFAEALTIDQIGAIYGVHRSTAARRVARARSELLGEARRQLSIRLGVETVEIDSVLRIVGSQFDLSLSRAFDDSTSESPRATA